ncbi:putative zinc metalloproteinase, putative [Candida dubliniensis CD36]|uniref:Zinc metalloproteinase, putative n=1 Tax=Candida dubliniensis (strain CD36 / ATCC MYA-646 / CBS 7987 / NCPF 3949 / NRRL Y-17841) TaxID=573826 RepID=B9WDM3_CANDC|nr:putative zinc metalloproteinase, putative [Candida dubliniensis CD36]CAX42779.1 putative zinc metalloproteinase, putative [Candida dubliniensis CD36]
MTILFNYQNDEIVSSPTVIVSGSTSTKLYRGVISFTSNQNKVFPPQYFEVNNGNFKAIIHVSPGERNVFQVDISDNGFINNFGFAEYSNGRRPNVVDSGTLTLYFNPLPQNKPIHLCLIRGRDSNNTYDMPGYKLQRGEVPTLENAIKKLKVAGRLMQAFTQDEMRSAGFSNRSFQFVEETVHDQTIFGYKVNSPTPHQEIKIHVLTSPKTVAELRSPDLAQQNPNAKDSGGLFNHAIDLVKDTPEIFNQRNGTAVQCACMYLDSTWQNNLILTHAALGGGTSEVKMAIFGSHGLHSYPQNFPLVTPSFLDATHLTTAEVANDCNECGTSWECLNICLGAYLHEIGHSLGCPHQVDGVMLRDYVLLNRSFMTRENECLRTKSQGQIIAENGTWPKICHWNRLDLIRFLYHDSFSLPIDNFGKIHSTTWSPDDSYQKDSALNVYPSPSNGSIVTLSSGIFLIEVITDDLARYHIEFLPREYGGSGLRPNVLLDFNNLYNELRSRKNDAKDEFSVRILSLGGDLNIDNFKEHCSEHSKEVIESDFGLNRGRINGFKSPLLGRTDDLRMEIVGFNIKTIYKVRVYHGGALDGMKFYYKSASSSNGGAPKIPKRDYLSKIVHGKFDFSSQRHHDQSPQQLTNISSGEEDRTALVGNETDNYSDFNLNPNEYITFFNFRDGAWMDAVQFGTNQGRLSPFFGKDDGGHLSRLDVPGDKFEIVGMYFYLNQWLRGLGIIYTTSKY